jgi:hypothetical protein
VRVAGVRFPHRLRRAFHQAPNPWLSRTPATAHAPGQTPAGDSLCRARAPPEYSPTGDDTSRSSTQRQRPKRPAEYEWRAMRTPYGVDQRRLFIKAFRPSGGLPPEPVCCDGECRAVGHAAASGGSRVRGVAGGGHSARTRILVSPSRRRESLSRDIRSCPVAVTRGARWWPSDLPGDGHQTCAAG